MNARIGLALITALLVAPGLGDAQTPSTQSTDVTFTIPVKLTKVPAAITKIRVGCTVTSTAILDTPDSDYKTSDVDYPISGGQFVGTVTIVVHINALNSAAQNSTASYNCQLFGYDPTADVGDREIDHGWGRFSPTAITPAFRLSPLLMPLRGTFTW